MDVGRLPLNWPSRRQSGCIKQMNAPLMPCHPQLGVGCGAYGVVMSGLFHTQSKEHACGCIRFPLESELVELILAAAVLPL